MTRIFTFILALTIICSAVPAQDSNTSGTPEEGGTIQNITQGTFWNNLQTAIFNANSGDELVLQPGDYGSGVFRYSIADSITIRSTDPADPAIVESTRIVTNASTVIHTPQNVQKTIKLKGLHLGGVFLDPFHEGELIIDRCWIDGSLFEFGEPAIGVITTSGMRILVTNSRITSAPSMFNISGGNNAVTLDIDQSLIVECNDGIVVNAFGNEFINLDIQIFQSTIVANNSAIIFEPTFSSSLFIGSSIVRGSILPNHKVFVAYGDSNLQGVIGKQGAGVIDSDPMFIDPDGPDNDPSTINDNDYSLLLGSPSVDTGSNSSIPSDASDLDNDGDTTEQTPLDLAGKPRIVNGIVDMGPYEYQGPPPCPADLTGDGNLNFGDVSAFLVAYGNQDPVADFFPDGLFNFTDVSIFLSAYGAGCP